MGAYTNLEIGSAAASNQNCVASEHSRQIIQYIGKASLFNSKTVQPQHSIVKEQADHTEV
jgi:hypothetical protein